MRFLPVLVTVILMATFGQRVNSMAGPWDNDPIEQAVQQAVADAAVLELINRDAVEAAVQQAAPQRETPSQDALREAAIPLLKQNEGYVPYPYKDSRGLWTIGIGHLIGDGSTKGEYAQYSKENPMPEAQVLSLFEEDFNEHLAVAQTFPVFNKLDTSGQLALLDMTFNMGGTRFGPQAWPNFFRQLESGDFEAAARNASSTRWFGQVKSRGPRIVELIRNAKLVD